MMNSLSVMDVLVEVQPLANWVRELGVRAFIVSTHLAFIYKQHSRAYLPELATSFTAHGSFPRYIR